MEINCEYATSEIKSFLYADGFSAGYSQTILAPNSRIIHTGVPPVLVDTISDGLGYIKTMSVINESEISNAVVDGIAMRAWKRISQK